MKSPANAFLRAMRWLVVVFLAGCGARSEPPSVVEPKPIAPRDADVALVPDAAVPVALPTCTDGGGVVGAAATADDVRFCVEEKDRKTCWAVAIATSAVTPVDPRTAFDGATMLELGRDRAAVATPWTVKVEDNKSVEVCGPDGCKPFPLVPSKNPDDGIDDARISATGKHVAVVRGMTFSTRQMIDIYDRASGKRLGVASPKKMCVSLQGFANETAVAVEWDCANQGGDRILLAPTGKLVARITRLSARADPFMQIDGDRWAFSEIHTASIEIYDVATGKRYGGRELEQFARVTTHGGRAFAFENEKARVYVFDKDGKQIAIGRAPTCRYEWEAEALGPLRLLGQVTELTKAIGAPAKKSAPDIDNMHRATWTFANGLVVTVVPTTTNMVTGAAVGPWLVIGFAITAPSKHRIRDVGIGSTLDDLRRAFGAHEVKSHTTDTRFVAGNAGERDGIQFTLVDGKVTRIQMGD